MLVLIAVCTFVTIWLLVLGLTMRSEREIIQKRLQQHSQTDDSRVNAVEPEVEPGFQDRVLLPFLRSLADLGSKLTPGGAARNVDEKLETAGRPWNLGSREFLGLKALSVAAFVVIALAVAHILDDTAFVKVLVMVILIFIGVVLPDYLLQVTISQRQSQIRKSLADTLDLLTVSVEAGLGLDGAMQKVVEKLRGPLSDEMTRALQEMQIGRLRADALRDMSKRVSIHELTSFVAAICQADQLGVSIARVLRVQSEMLRTQRSQRTREIAAKLPVKLLFPLVFCIFPAIFVVIVAPGAISIFRTLGIMQ